MQLMWCIQKNPYNIIHKEENIVKKTSLVILIMMLIMVFTPLAMADTPDTAGGSAVVTQNTSVTPVSPQDGANRINTALLRVYEAGVGLVPNIAFLALLIGIIFIIFSAALGLDRFMKISIAGVFIIFGAVIVIYAAPLLMSIAVGIGSNM